MKQDSSLISWRHQEKVSSCLFDDIHHLHHYPDVLIAFKTSSWEDDFQNLDVEAGGILEIERPVTQNHLLFELGQSHFEVEVLIHLVEGIIICCVSHH